MSSSPWMLDRLALETRVHHAHADEDRLAALDITTVADYRTFLVRVHGLEASVERGFVRVGDLDPALLRGRAKEARLRHDLIALGVADHATMARMSAPAINMHTVPHALGWLYVIERHTLLAGLIRRHLVRMLGAEVERATSYLSAYESPGARFRGFGITLGKYAQHYPPSAIVAAACEAFRVQRQWYLQKVVRRERESAADTQASRARVACSR